MDLLDLLILALRIALVALLYLFLLVVMRTAARGLRGAPRAAPVPASLQLVVVEPGDTHLRAGQAIEVADGATLGRQQAEVTLADPAVSAEHARIRRIGRAWVVSDLGSTNGTRVNDARVNGEMPLAHGDVLTLGNVRLQVNAR
jgi:hypothetical protein